MTRYLWHEPITTLEATLAQADPRDRFDFDDGYASHRAAAGILERAGRRGTFYIVTRWLGLDGFLTVTDVRALAFAGHEIGNHTASHVWLGKIPAVARELEIREAQDRLAAITHVPPRSFAYPYGLVDEAAAASVAAFGFTLARGIDQLEARR